MTLFATPKIPKLTDDELVSLAANQFKKTPVLIRRVGNPYILGYNFHGHKICGQDCYVELFEDQPGEISVITYIKEN